MTGFWSNEPSMLWQHECVPLEHEYVDILRACLQSAANNVDKISKVNGKTITRDNIEELAQKLGVNIE